MKTANQTYRNAQPGGKGGKSFSLLWILMLVVAQTGTVFGGIITPDRLVDWTPGASVGVPGGIPTSRTSLIDVTQSPYNADKTGVNDAQPAIQAAINAATSNKVIYLPAGTYRINSQIKIPYNIKGVTLRGAGAGTVIMGYGASTSGIYVGSDSSYDFSYPPTGNQVSAGLGKGSTSVTIPDTSAFTVGDIIQFGMANDTSIPVISIMGYNLLPANQPLRIQNVHLTAKTANTLSFWPPLYADYSSVIALVHDASLQGTFVGLENFTLDMSNSTYPTGITMEQCYGCWASNVTVRLSKNYNIFLWNSLNCEVRHCRFDSIVDSASNGGGILFNSTCATLIEDNIDLNAFPGIEVNHGSAGNVFAYNFFQNTNGLATIDSNHSPHNNFNLYEGNICNSYECDGYFGGDSHDSIYRNWINGQYTGGASNKIGWAFSLKRFTYYNSMVGNILGTPNVTMPGDCVELGHPNMGNSSFTGYGPPWIDGWTNGPGTISVNGTTATASQPFFTPDEINDPNNSKSWGILIQGRLYGIASYVSPTSVTLQASASYANVPYILTPETWGFQELDTNVARTLIRQGNYYYYYSAIPANEALGTNILQSSLYRTTQPAWFGSLTWPPFNPAAPNPTFDSVPAGYRYNHGIDPPGIGGGVQPPVAVAGAVPSSGAVPLPVAFSSTGSFDPGGGALTYSWVFGDGSTSTAANPSHTYQSVGTYSAQLTVSDGTNQTPSSVVTITVTNVVTSIQPPVAVAGANPTSGSPPLLVNFSSAGSFDPGGGALTYSWVFGDGATSTAANPSHTYQSAGSYSAKLTVSDGTNQASSGVVTITASAGTSVNPVAAYGFEEGSGTTVSDASGNGNTGTITGATWTAAGRFGKALFFNGTNSQITINDSPSLDLTTGLTVEAWVLPATNNPAAWMCILYKPLDSGSVAYALQGASKPSPQAPSLGLSFLTSNLFAPTALPLNTWSHLVATFDGTTEQLYVNGVQVASQVQPGAIGTSAQPITIGGAWQGLIDEVRVYNRALSAAEIQTDMNNSVVLLAPAPPPPTGLRLISN